jgi:hypothetical protein
MPEADAALSGGFLIPDAEAKVRVLSGFPGALTMPES